MQYSQIATQERLFRRTHLTRESRPAAVGSLGHSSSRATTPRTKYLQEPKCTHERYPDFRERQCRQPKRGERCGWEELLLWRWSMERPERRTTKISDQRPEKHDEKHTQPLILMRGAGVAYQYQWESSAVSRDFTYATVNTPFLCP
jgi:hypothetical protein